MTLPSNVRVPECMSPMDWFCSSGLHLLLITALFLIPQVSDRTPTLPAEKDTLPLAENTLPAPAVSPETDSGIPPESFKDVGTVNNGVLENSLKETLSAALPTDLPPDIRADLESKIQAVIDQELNMKDGAPQPQDLQALAMEGVQKILSAMKNDLEKEYVGAVLDKLGNQITGNAWREMQSQLQKSVGTQLQNDIRHAASSLSSGDADREKALGARLALNLVKPTDTNLTESSREAFKTHALSTLSERVNAAIKSDLEKRGLESELDAEEIVKEVSATASQSSDKMKVGMGPVWDSFRKDFNRAARPDAETQAQTGVLQQNVIAQANNSLPELAKNAAAHAKFDPRVRLSEKLDSKFEVYRRLSAAATNLASGRGMTGDPGLASGFNLLLGGQPSTPNGAATGEKGGGVGQGSGKLDTFQTTAGMGQGRSGIVFDDVSYQKIIQQLQGRETGAGLEPELARLGAENETRLGRRLQSATRPVGLLFVDDKAIPSVMPNTPPLPTADSNKIAPPPFPTLVWTAAPHASQAPIVDGDLSEWKMSGPKAEVRVMYDGSRIDQGPDVYFQWRAEGLYFAYFFADETGVQVSSGAPYHGDCLELFIDTTNSRVRSLKDSDTAHQFFYMPYGFKGDSTETFLRNGGKVPIPRGKTLAELNQQRQISFSTAKPVPGGYNVEGFLSVTAMNRKLLPGLYLGMDMSISRNFNFNQQIQWATSKSAGGWARPDTWGDLMLLGTDARADFIHSAQKSEKRTSIGMNEEGGIEIIDPDMNLNSQALDSVAVRVDAEKSMTSQVFLLSETGPDTGIFRGAFTLQALGLEPRPGFLGAQSGDKLRLTYIDSVRSNGQRNIPVNSSMKVGWPVMNLVLQNKAGPQSDLPKL